jgi:uncharacterized damage-inducible protein DinB
MRKNQIAYIPEFYQRYIESVGEERIVEVLNTNQENTQKLLFDVTEDEGNFRYAEGKWSLKEVVSHLIDVERIMSYRALCIARKDVTELPGFDEDAYVANSQADKRRMADLAREFAMVRRATIEQFRSFDDEALLQTGTANKSQMSVLLLGFIIAGHENHHIKIIKERYLQEKEI